jgi:hypothetical protein
MSLYQAINISFKNNDAYLVLVLVAPFLFFSFVSMNYSAIYHNQETEGRIRGIISRTIDGLSHMEVSDVSIAFVACIVVAFGMAYVIYAFTDVKQIIVELWFDDKQKELKLVRGNSRGDTLTKIIKYSDITYSYTHQSDGLSDQVHSAIVIGSKSEKFGGIYENHFTWSNIQYKEIEDRLKSLNK